MRPIWKGTISFGLVAIPVKLYTATEAHDVSFRQVHAADGGRIRYKRVCELDGQEVPYSDIAKGYELPGGEIVVLTDEDFANLPLASSKEIDVVEFVPAEQIDPILYNKAYYAEPDKSVLGAKASEWPVPYWLVDTAFATMLMLLTATDVGLGALFFGLDRGEAELLEALGVPDGYHPIGAVALGWPAPDRPSPSLRRGHRPARQVIHRGGW